MIEGTRHAIPASLDDVVSEGRQTRSLVARLGDLRSASLTLLIIAAFLGIWQLSSSKGLIDPFFVSSPQRVAVRLWAFTHDARFWTDLTTTVKEAGLGFVYGVASGVVVGFTLAQSRVLSAAILPLLNLLNTLPRVALAPLFILWFGIGTTAKVVLVMTVVFTIIVFNTYSGAQTVDPDIKTVARLLGANRLQMLLRITLPWTVPWILTGMRIALAWSIGAAVVGEYIAATKGIGLRIFTYSQAFDQTGLLAGCVVLLIVSGTAFVLIGIVERRLMRWRPQ